MYQKISTEKMEREEWLALRKTGIGGSDAGTVCGINPYSSAMKLFYDKTGKEVEEQENEAMRQGHDLENYVVQRFTEATGLKVRRSNYMYRNTEYPFMIADVDRLVVGEDAGLECKTASAYQADKWKDGDIPLHYMLQCYHYMAVTGKRTWYIAAVILGKEFVYHRLEWDNELIESLIHAEKRFWEDYIIPRKMPNPDGSKICNEILNQYFHSAKDKSVVKLVGFDEKLDRRAEIIKQVDSLQQELTCIEQEIKLFMQENERAFSEKYRISWVNVKSIRLDTKLLKQEKPEIYKEYAKPSSSRKFQIRVA
ncbi:MAG: endonuclease [Eubacterium sp.]|nr:endonuclease [Eubacterium sp.]